MKSSKMAILTGLFLFGYWYLKNNPQTIESMRKTGMEACQMLYNCLDSE